MFNPFYIVTPNSPWGAYKSTKTAAQELRERQDQEELFARLMCESRQQEDQNTTTPTVGGIPFYYGTPINGNTIVSLPNGFTWQSPFQIQRTYNNTFIVSPDVSTLFPVRSNTYYVNSVSGNDSNNGSTPLLAKKLLSSMLTALIASPPISAEIILTPGTYNGGFLAKAINFPLTVKCPNGIAYMSPDDNGSNYTTQFSSSCYYKSGTSWQSGVQVVDMNFTSSYGVPYKLTYTSSINACINTPGTYSDSGSATNLYVHLLDNRVPDNKMLTYAQTLTGIYLDFVPTGSTVCFENLTCVGFSIGLLSRSSRDLTLIAKNCKFYYATSPVFNQITWQGGSFVYLQDCEASNGLLDGFNYHSKDGFVPKVVEINCRAVLNGSGSGGTNNGSTAHDGETIIRINGYYSYNQDRNIHDVNTGTTSWNLGCFSGYSTGSIVLPVNTHNVNWACSLEGTTDTPKMWLDSCVSTGSITDIAAWEKSTIYIHNMNTSSMTIISSSNVIPY